MADDMKKKLEAERKAKETGDPRVTHFTGEKQDSKTEGEVNINMNNNTNTDLPFNLDEIIGTTEDKTEKVLVGIYFDPEVKRALEKVNRKKGRGAKSEFVNNITKWALKQQGYM